MTENGPATHRLVDRTARRGGLTTTGGRAVPEEVPIAFSYRGSNHAVMMGTPADFKDFAYGFSLTEGIIASRDDVEAVEVLADDKGFDVQVTLVDAAAEALTSRRRHMAGPVGCGLCGIESIEQAIRPVPTVSARASFGEADIAIAVNALHGHQPLHALTHAVHGAGFYVPGRGLIAVREDVGRHNALDKLAGAVLRSGIDGAGGAVVVTSRISVEMVQKTALLGSALLIAISAPTALAIETAEAAGITLVALARGQDHEIFTHPEIFKTGGAADVA